MEFFKSVVSEVVSLSDPGKSGVGRISYPSSIIAPTEQPNVSSDSNQPHTTNKEASTRQAYNHLCKHHYHHQLCQGIPATSSDCNPASRAVVCPLFLYLLLWLYPLPYPSCHPLLSDMNGCWVPMCIGDWLWVKEGSRIVSLLESVIYADRCLDPPVIYVLRTRERERESKFRGHEGGANPQVE